jgi:hypothetical protein
MGSLKPSRCCITCTVSSSLRRGAAKKMSTSAGSVVASSGALVAPGEPVVTPGEVVVASVALEGTPVPGAAVEVRYLLQPSTMPASNCNRTQHLKDSSVVNAS